MMEGKNRMQQNILTTKSVTQIIILKIPGIGPAVRFIVAEDYLPAGKLTAITAAFRSRNR